MNPLESRVTLVPTVPHYPSLAKALQNDMLETAITLRHALYDLHFIDGLTGGLQGRLEKALVTLDFPHFIPMQNTEDALYQEYLDLRELFYNTPLLGYRFSHIAMQFFDVYTELDRCGFWTEIVLEDMTAVVVSIEPENFEPIENTFEAINECLEEIKALAEDYPMPSQVGWNLLAMGIDIADHLRTRQDGE